MHKVQTFYLIIGNKYSMNICYENEMYLSMHFIYNRLEVPEGISFEKPINLRQLQVLSKSLSDVEG